MKPARFTAELRQWCPQCMRATPNIECPTCPGTYHACAEYGTHPDHIELGDDDEVWPEVEDYDNE